MRAIPLIALVAGAAPDEPIEFTNEGRNFCGSTSTELTTSAPTKYQPVGFLNNGCTAFLLDGEHVAAAAHCFVNGSEGTFQADLRFYPNFHPDMVTADPNRVPHATLDRAVVGSRVDRLFPWSDWGIAHVSRWDNIDGGSLSYAELETLEPYGIGEPPVEVEHVAYNRGKFPVRGPDMMFDTGLCSWAPQWARIPGDPPTGEWQECNRRWMSGTIYSDCQLLGNVDDTIRHNCETWGGSSGAPLMRDHRDGSTTVVGLTSGGPVVWHEVPQPRLCEFDSDCGTDPFLAFCRQNQCVNRVSNEAFANAQCIPRDDKNLQNIGPASARFIEAPRFASNVAVARRPDGTSATAVFGVDADRNQVVMRERLGVGPTHDSRFAYWRPLPTITEHRLANIAACSDLGGHPMVVVTATQGGQSRLLRTRFDPKLDAWLAWQSIDLPAADGRVVDIDAAYDDDGTCMLFALDPARKAISSTNLTNADWGDPVRWRTIATRFPTTGSKLSALRDDDGFLWLATIDDAGKLHAFSKTCNDRTQVWYHYDVASRLGVTRWRDLDYHWSDKGEGRLVAIPENGDTSGLVEYKLPRRECWSPGNGPEDDTSLPAMLWNPSSTTVVKPDLRTLTGSRWLEDKPGTVSPNIFATDSSGNVYMISNTPGHGWSFEWQSFYHETLVHP
jgi:hypothetical protein